MWQISKFVANSAFSKNKVYNIPNQLVIIAGVGDYDNGMQIHQVDMNFFPPLPIVFENSKCHNGVFT